MGASRYFDYAVSAPPFPEALEAQDTMRVSMGRLTGESDVDELIEALTATIRRQRWLGRDVAR